MKKELKNIIVIAVFAVFVAIFLMGSVIAPDKGISYAERRELRQRPEFSFEEIWNGEYFEELEKYFLDQFWQRDWFRVIKALASGNVFLKKDNNGVYVLDGKIYKLDYRTNEGNIQRFAKVLENIKHEYLEGCDVLYAVVPDKNYFTAKQNGYPALDYGKLLYTMQSNMSAGYIDLFGALALGDYYGTDLHWRQDKIIGVAEKILQAFGAESPNLEFEEHRLEGFAGSYYGQAALPLNKDDLIYLTNEILSACVVRDGLTGDVLKMYDIDAFYNHVDGYDLFCGGPNPLVTIENPSGEGELVIFRDSYASNLAPLLAMGYGKITLVDLRYMSSRMVGNFVEFGEGTDVLFLYGTQSVNSIVIN